MATVVTNNFSGGVISPVLYGRSDLKAYYKSCAEANNFIVTKEGTLRKRRGIRSLYTIWGDYSLCTLIPYKYDRTEGGFLLLRGNTNGSIVASFHGKDGELKNNSIVINDVLRTDVDVSQQMKAIHSKQIGDQLWISNGEFFRYITVHNNDSISVSEWSQAEVPPAITLNSNVNDVSTHWSIAPSQHHTGRTIYYGVVTVKDSVNSDTSKGSCSWSVSWEAGTYINLHATLAIEDKTKWSYIIFCKRSGGTYGELTRVYMDDTPDEFLYTDNTTLKKAYKWDDGKWYDKEQGLDVTEQTEVTITHHRYTFRDENHVPSDAVYGQTNVLGTNFNSPLCVDCFQQRRVFANAHTDGGAFPMTVWFSEVGNLNNFYADRPTADDDPFSATITSIGPAFIRWTCCYQDLMVLFTDCGLFSVGFAQTQGFSASTCRIVKFSHLCVSPNIQPVVTDAGIVFVGADNKTLYTASFDLQENSLKPINRTVLVEHLTRNSKIVALGLQEFPDSVVWMATEDGNLCTFTFEKSEEVYAWSTSSIKNAKVRDVIALGTVTDGVDSRTNSDIYFVIEKQDKYYIATLQDTYKDEVGNLTCNVEASFVSLRPESQEKTIVGKRKNIKDILVKVYETGEVKARNNNGVEQNLLPMVGNTEDGLYSGDLKVMPRGVFDEKGVLRLVSDDDKACEILQTVIELEVT